MIPAHTAEDLGLLFGAMVRSKTALFQRSEDELQARENLKRAEATIIHLTDPKTLGANEAARNASIRAQTVAEREAVEKADRAKREAQLTYELDCMAVDCLKWQIRATTGVM
jgi:hypothetical protein